jgi:hypothetical protein
MPQQRQEVFVSIEELLQLASDNHWQVEFTLEGELVFFTGVIDEQHIKDIPDEEEPWDDDSDEEEIDDDEDDFIDDFNE